MHYRVQLTDATKSPIFTTKDGSGILGKISQYDNQPGHIVFLPHFELATLTQENEEGEDVWSEVALGAGTVILKQLRAIDKLLRKESSLTPPPTWVDTMPKSSLVAEADKQILKAKAKIIEAIDAKEELVKIRQSAEEINHLLFETGTPLEEAIKKTLTMLGYVVSNFRDGDLEIDHIIISPEGVRIIGEAEGKDTSAIDISKFRQLESNIGEDFEREEVSDPATGVLFGNGFRLIDPKDRSIQFTEKCFKNAQRLGIRLVQTADLYPIAIYLQDNPNDDDFKSACRKVLESSTGQLVVFPKVPTLKK